MIALHCYGRARPGGSKGIVNGRLVESGANELRQWRKEVALQGRLAMRGARPLAGPVALGVVFLIERPKTVSRRLPAVKPDVTKLLRPFEDALTELVWKDDSQVVVTVAWKQYADGLAPGATAVVGELDELVTQPEAIELVTAALRQVLDLRGQKTRRESLAVDLGAGLVHQPVAAVAERDEVRVDVVAAAAPMDQVVPLEPAPPAAQTALALEP